MSSGNHRAPSARERAADALVVRPFMVTGGRTAPQLGEVRIESLVQATQSALSAPLRDELRAAARLCQQPRSVAEISVALGVPVGVAKVLVGDLVEAGHATLDEVDCVEIATLERIRDLMRAL